MSWPIYSERLLAGGGVGGGYGAVVPAGHRAVIKSGAFSCGQYAGSDINVYIAGQLLFLRSFQAPYTSVQWDTMAVAYAGESIGVVAHFDETYWFISGYLFSDPSGRRGDALQTEAMPELEELFPGTAAIGTDV